ncbi:MAG: choline ABC transporter ATP-binding protein [Gammaproteobacteria bacterium]|nr:choline ABC transporter ATP-binding protein [Gammaproteobacteria bacterium]
MSEALVRFNHVDIVFGDDPQRALPLIDAGETREVIAKETGQTLGVAGCDLEVSAGEVLVIMGLSGSGKSTLLRAVNALNPVVRGSVSVRMSSEQEWRDPHRCTKAQLRELRLDWVSMVFQQFALLPWRTVAENVGFGLELAGQQKRTANTQIHQQLELVGLSEWADKKVHELSGGMQQRVGLARAFATDAPILLMDEPYSALDPLIRSRLQDELIALQSQLRRTILFVSHDLDEAMKIGSRIAIMEGGRLVQVGTPQEIFANPANQYVADFVEHMNPLTILRARHVMQPTDTLPAEHANAVQVSPDANLSDIMREQLASELPVYVVSENQVMGKLDAADVHRALLRV